MAKRTKAALAIAAHPDDIEFMMAGTLILLGKAGYELHYMNVANGSCGTAVHDKDEIVAMRDAEARKAAAMIGAEFHPPLCDDLEIYYDRILVAKLAAVVRKVNPEIVLLQSPIDYMEDHTNSVRLGVTAAFCRPMKNFVTDPPVPPVFGDTALYHSMPAGIRGPLREEVPPHFYVDVGSTMKKKRAMLACHRSQKEWLDESQGMDSYLITMENFAAEVGRRSGRFKFAEGWRRHSHLGYAAEASFDPLAKALAKYVHEAS